MYMIGTEFYTISRNDRYYPKISEVIGYDISEGYDYVENNRRELIFLHIHCTNNTECVITIKPYVSKHSIEVTCALKDNLNIEAIREVPHYRDVRTYRPGGGREITLSQSLRKAELCINGYIVGELINTQISVNSSNSSKPSDITPFSTEEMLEMLS